MKNDVEVFVMNIAPIINQPIDKYLSLFSYERQKKILQYKFNSDRNRTIFAELLLRYAVNKKFSIPIEKILVERDENGKPFLTGNFLEISLSHSKNWVACSFGKIPNGVDIESESSDALEIAKNFFTAEEYNVLRSLSEKELSQEFLKMWTIKESRFKCVGDINFNKNLFEKNFILNDGTVIGLACFKNADLLPAKRAM